MELTAEQQVKQVYPDAKVKYSAVRTYCKIVVGKMGKSISISLSGESNAWENALLTIKNKQA